MRRLLARAKLVVVGVGTDPEPKQVRFLLHGEVIHNCVVRPSC